MSIDIDQPLPRADRSTRGGQNAITLIVGCLATLDSGQVPTWQLYRSRPTDPTPVYDKMCAALNTDLERLANEWRWAKEDGATLSEAVLQPNYPYLIPSRPLSYSAYTRKTDPDTSRQAARTVADPNKGTYGRILAAFKTLDQYGVGFTDDELFTVWREQHRNEASWPEISPSGLRSRRNELTKRGLIVDSGQRRKSNAGRNSIVWRLA